MRLVVVTEQRIIQSPDGTHWAEQGGDYAFWSRYREAFDEVRLVARALPGGHRSNTARRVDGDGVNVWPIPYYVGLGGYLRNSRQINRRVREAAEPCDGVLLRVPSQLGTILASHRRRAGLPFALEMVGDPYDVFAPGATAPPMRPLLRRIFTRNQRAQARNALGVAYVTERTLQLRYPPRAGAVATHYSSIELNRDAFETVARRFDTPPTQARLISIGSLEQPYKGIDVLLESLAKLRRSNLSITLTHVGDGRYRQQLEQAAAALGIDTAVTFTGHIPPGEAVRRHLRAADMFILPSRTEGLPRALIEAMALGLPAIASTAGGSPELLEPNYLVAPGDAEMLANAIKTLLMDPYELSLASQRNLRRAKDFDDATLRKRRQGFYAALRQGFEGALSR